MSVPEKEATASPTRMASFPPEQEFNSSREAATARIATTNVIFFMIRTTCFIIDVNKNHRNRNAFFYSQKNCKPKNRVRQDRVFLGNILSKIYSGCIDEK